MSLSEQCPALMLVAGLQAPVIHRAQPRRSQWNALPMSPPGDEGNHHVGGMLIEVLLAVVVNRRCPWISMARGDLHLSKRNSCL